MHLQSFVRGGGLFNHASGGGSQKVLFWPHSGASSEGAPPQEKNRWVLRCLCALNYRFITSWLRVSPLGLLVYYFYCSQALPTSSSPLERHYKMFCFRVLLSSLSNSWCIKVLLNILVQTLLDATEVRIGVWAERCLEDAKHDENVQSETDVYTPMWPIGVLCVPDVPVPNIFLWMITMLNASLTAGVIKSFKLLSSGNVSAKTHWCRAVVLPRVDSRCFQKNTNPMERHDARGSSNAGQ